MFRLSQAEETSQTTLTIDGHLLRDSVEVVESSCDQALSRGKPVHLYLRNVATIDAAGRALLRRLAVKGIQLLAAGVYTSDLVRRAQEPLR